MYNLGSKLTYLVDENISTPKPSSSKLSSSTPIFSNSPDHVTSQLLTQKITLNSPSFQTPTSVTPFSSPATSFPRAPTSNQQNSIRKRRHHLRIELFGLKNKRKAYRKFVNRAAGEGKTKLLN